MDPADIRAVVVTMTRPRMIFTGTWTGTVKAGGPLVMLYQFDGCWLLTWSVNEWSFFVPIFAEPAGPKLHICNIGIVSWRDDLKDAGQMSFGRSVNVFSREVT